MSQEIIYTSAPKGLKPGSRGFCTVVSTHGLAKNLADALESLSGYRHVYPPQSPEASLNPVVYSHVRLTVGGRPYHVLSRIADAGLDYTQRTNKFAHHVALDSMELPAGGPAWLLAQPQFMATGWAGEPQVRPTGPRPPQGDQPAGVCQAWQRLTGDAGWAGVLAETALPETTRNVVIVARPGIEVLPLLVEALALVPVPLRWQVTLSTYFTKLPPGVECKWRCVLEETPEALALKRAPNTLVIDLTRPLGTAVGGSLVNAARTGIAAPQSYGANAVTSMATGHPSDDGELEALLAEEAAAMRAAGLDGAVSHGAPFRAGPPPRRNETSFNFEGQASTSGQSSRSRSIRRWRILAATLVIVAITAGAFAWYERDRWMADEIVVEETIKPPTNGPSQGLPLTDKTNEPVMDASIKESMPQNAGGDGDSSMKERPAEETPQVKEKESSNGSPSKEGSDPPKPEAVSAITPPKASTPGDSQTNTSQKKATTGTQEMPPKDHDALRKQWEILPAAVDIVLPSQNTVAQTLFTFNDEVALKLLEPIDNSGAVLDYGKGKRFHLDNVGRLYIGSNTSGSNTSKSQQIAEFAQIGENLVLNWKAVPSQYQSCALLKNCAILVAPKDTKLGIEPKHISLRISPQMRFDKSLLDGILYSFPVNGLTEASLKLSLKVTGDCSNGKLRPQLRQEGPKNQYRLYFIDEANREREVFLHLTIEQQKNSHVLVKGSKPKAVTPGSPLSPVELSASTCKGNLTGLRNSNPMLESDISRIESTLAKTPQDKKLIKALGDKRQIEKDISQWEVLSMMLDNLSTDTNLTISGYVALTENRYAQIVELELESPAK